MTTTPLTAGFADAARDAQAVFRAVMGAMSRPGTIVRLSPVVEAPAPLTSACAAVALTLCDGDTPVWLDKGLAAAPEVARFLRFHTGVPLVAHPAEAAFALALDATDLPPLADFALGSLDDPDRSTTLILAVATLEEGSGWRLAGPGIEGEARFFARPVPDEFLARRAALAPLFPRGLDIVFVAGDRVAALPRTTRLEP